jgi:uncharacterized membrane protein YeaQ/YmgE (transglycosylase-associated protein family)
MTAGQIIVYLVVALICGLLGQLLAGRSIGGFIMSTLLGVIGAVIGRAVAAAIHAPEPLVISFGGESIPVVWAVIGAALFTLVVSLFQRRRVLVVDRRPRL